jgi:YD repeat-containing protein
MDIARCLSVSALTALLAASARPPATTTYEIDTSSMRSFGYVTVRSTDLALGASFPFPAIERVHRSAYPAKGWFGSGWTSRYDAKLEFEGDGTIEVTDYDNDRRVTFVPESGPRSIDLTVDEDVDAAQRAHALAGAGAVQKYRRQLRDNAPYALEEWALYRDASIIMPRKPGTGEIFHTRDRDQELIRVASGYQRRHLAGDSGVFEAFDDKGRLLRVWDAKHRFVRVSYDDRGDPDAVSDDRGNRITIKFARLNCTCVDAVDDGHGRTVTYRYAYNNRDTIDGRYGWNLVAVNADGRTTRLAYDSKHRLTGVRDDAGRQIELAYDAPGRIVSRTVRGAQPARTYSYSVDTEVRGAIVSTADQPRGDAAAERTVYLFAPGEKEVVHYLFETRSGATAFTEFDDKHVPIAQRTIPGATVRLDGLSADTYNRIGDLMLGLRSYADALAEYQQAAALKDGQGNANVAYMYWTGHGVERDFTQAMHYAELADVDRVWLGDLILVQMYLDGTKGVAKSCAKANDYFQRAVKHGFSSRQSDLREQLRVQCPTSPAG